MKEETLNQQDQPESEESKIGLSRMVKITNKQKDKLEGLISRTIDTLQGYKQEFKTAAEKRDKEALDNLIHKGTMTIYYIEAEKLDRLMHQTREAIDEKHITAEQLGKKIQKTSSEFDTVINQLEAVNINALLAEH